MYGCTDPSAFSLCKHIPHHMERKAFLDQEPPPGYVAGVGRGASGFSTSADTGPMRFESDFGTEVDGENAQAGILAQTSAFSAEDEEADRIYEEIDRRVRKRRQKADTKDQPSLDKVEIPTGTGVIQHLFTDLKSDLGKVTMDEWENLPLVGDLTRKNKRQRLLAQQLQRSYAAPDALIAGSGAGSGAASAQTQTSSNEGGVNVSDIEEWERQHAKMGDVDKGRQILASLRRTQPHKADSWISLARLEEQAKNWSLAKTYIKQGCNAMPRDELVWLESIRLHRSDGVALCKSLMNEALRLNSQSEKLWLAAVKLENPADVFSQKKVLMKALEFLPSSPSLWKELIKLEDNDHDKNRLLSKATDLCPTEWDFWLGYINHSSYAESKTLLNKARKLMPQEIKVWTTALKLEERENSEVTLKKLLSMVTKGSLELAKNSADISPDKWLEESILAETERFPKSSRTLVHLSMEKVPHLLDMVRLAEDYSAKNEAVSGYIRSFIAEQHPEDEANWRHLFEHLRRTDRLQLYAAYEKAIAHNPKLELLHLMCAKDQWILEADVEAARKTLEKALDHNGHSEEIWSARIKLEVRNSCFDKALLISRDSLRAIGDTSARMWYKYIHLLRFCHSKKLFQVDDNTLRSESARAYSEHVHEKIILQRSQVLIDLGDVKGARETLSTGTKICAQSTSIWIALSDLDLKNSSPARARSSLDTALLDLQNEPSLWEARINLELQLNEMVYARQLINRSLKLIPSSPELWLLYLRMIPKMAHRKNGFLDALKKTDNSTQVLLGIGVFFWIDGKFAKAKAWFERSLNSDRGNGDVWAWMYCFHSKHGKHTDAKGLIDALKKHFDAISKGRTWIAVVKDPRNLDMSPESCVKLVAEKLLQTKV